MKAEGLSEATQSLFWVRGALTKWGFLIKTNATLTCLPSRHLVSSGPGRPSSRAMELTSLPSLL